MIYAAVIAALLVQDAAQEATQEAGPVPTDEVVDEIIVRGGKINPGLAAFEAGDFATAEIEFTKSARCALRVERNKAAALDQLRSSQIGQDVRGQGLSNGGSQAGANASQTDINGAGGGPVQTATRRPDEEVSVGTCGNRGFQVYMRGLSRLQLGKVAEAKDDFDQAVTIDKNLYDAHYRLGLIDLLEGNEKGARRHLKRMRTISKRCRRDCDVRDEIDASIADLSARLG